MSQGFSHVFSEIYLHLNWHCRNDEPMITADIEPDLYELVRAYCRKVKGIHFERVGGTEDHVHLVFQMEPFVLLSEFIGKIKGSTSHDINKQFGADTLKWQRGYGIVSFSRKHLRAVLRYVEKQKEHHERGTANEVLEACGRPVHGGGG